MRPRTNNEEVLSLCEFGIIRCRNIFTAANQILIVAKLIERRTELFTMMIPLLQQTNISVPRGWVKSQSAILLHITE